MTKVVTDIEALKRISADLTAQQAEKEPADPVVEMGQRIAALIERGRQFEGMVEAILPGNESRREHIRDAARGCYHEQDAAEEYALAMQPRSLAGAAVQLMLACNRIDLVEDDIEDARAQKDCQQIRRALRSALPLIADAANFDLRSVGGDWFLSEEDLAPFNLAAAE